MAKTETDQPEATPLDHWKAVLAWALRAEIEDLPRQTDAQSAAEFYTASIQRIKSRLCLDKPGRSIVNQ